MTDTKSRQRPVFRNTMRVVGNISNEPKMYTLADGGSVQKFDVAVNHKVTGPAAEGFRVKIVPIFYSVTSFRPCDRLRKGDYLTFQGIVTMSEKNNGEIKRHLTGRDWQILQWTATREKNKALAAQESLGL